MEHYSKEETRVLIHHLVFVLNGLHKGIGSTPLLTYEDYDNSVYLYGVTDDLLHLHSLLQHRCYQVTCFQEMREGKRCLECALY